MSTEKTPNQTALPIIALIFSITSLVVSVACSIVYIVLLVQYEKDYIDGDGFMLVMPAMCWLYLVLPLGGIATTLTLAGCFMKDVTQRTFAHFTLIVLSLPLLPLLVVYALFEVARWP